MLHVVENFAVTYEVTPGDSNSYNSYYCVYTIVLLFLFVGPMLVQVYLPLCPAVSFSANKFDLI